MILNEVADDRDTIFSQNYACEDCGISLPELSPRMFSFNNPYGACPVCSGLGTQLVADPDLVIPDWDKSILDGAIQASGFNNVKDDSIARMYFEALAKKYKFSLTTPMKDLPKDALHAVLYGTGKENLTIYYERANGRGTLERPFEGVLNNVSRRLTETQSDAMRKELEECMSERPCPKCHGNRLSDISLAVTVGGLSIMDFCRLPVQSGAGLYGAFRAHGLHGRHRRADFAGNSLPASLLAGGRAFLSDAFARGGDALRRREPENPACNPDWLEPYGRSLHSRRALHRPSPAR